MKLFKITILSLLTVSLLSNTATAACYSYAKPWGYVRNLGDRWYNVTTYDEDVQKYTNSYLIVYRAGYASWSKRFNGTQSIKLTKGLYSFYAENFTSCGATGQYWWFADVQVQ